MARGLKGQVALEKWLSGDHSKGVKKFLQQHSFVVLMDKDQNPILNSGKLLIFTDVNTAAEFANFNEMIPAEITPLRFNQMKGLDLFKEFNANSENIKSLFINLTAIDSNHITPYELTDVSELLDEVAPSS
jgi:hypothetical protein